MKARMAKMIFVLAVFMFLVVNYTRGAETWTTLNKPGAYDTSLHGKSSNNIVGIYNSGPNWQGFFYDGTDWADLNMTVPEMTWTNTQPQGIDDKNIVGFYFDASYLYHGFLYDGTNWTPLSAPEGTNGTRAYDISGNNVTGYYEDATGHKQGFIYDILKESWITLDMPLGAEGVAPFSIDDNNIVGIYYDVDISPGVPGKVHGFLYDGISYTTLDMLGATYTQPLGISGSNIVGEYDSIHGFLYDGKDWTTLDKPGETSTHPFDIDGNDVVGTYGDPQGFIYTIPEPSTLALLIAGSILFVAYLWRKQK